MVKAISLLSGGLDSILAMRLIQKQGVLLEAVTCDLPFISSKEAIDLSSDICRRFKIKHHIINLKNSSSYLEIIKDPLFGYGKNLNPCIDCHIFMLKESHEIMLKAKADFIVTGDVLGERPMSQKRATLNLIDKEVHLEGLVLRPLSAKLLKETLPEKKGLVKREELLDITGRSRKRQFELTEKLDVKDYLSPAGGCLLTEKEFCRKVKDLIDHDILKPENIPPLKIGRHFRIDETTKLIVGRNKEENGKINMLKKEEDIFLDTVSVPGPAALLLGEHNLENIKLASAIMASYTKTTDKVRIEYRKRLSDENDCVEVAPLKADSLKDYRI